MTLFSADGSRSIALLMQLVELLPLAKALADVIMPQEYGQTVEEKLAVGRAISQKIIAKILYDLRTACGKFDQRKDKDFMDEPLHRGDTSNSEDLRVPNSTETVRSRFYFTSESHINSIINLLRLGSNFGAAHSFLGPKKSGEGRGVTFLSCSNRLSPPPSPSPLLPPPQQQRLHGSGACSFCPRQPSGAI